MAEEILRSRHAFGSESGVDQAIADGKIDSYDILFLTTDDGGYKIGWLDKDGNKVILDDHDANQVLVVESLPETGEEGVIYICNSKFYYWNGVEFVTPTDLQGVSEDVVDAKVATAVNTVNDYTDNKVEATLDEVENSYEKIKYDVSDVPVGTLVKYLDTEIRIMCPADSQWDHQTVGEGGDANSYYMTFKTYVPNDDVVGYIEHLGDQVDSEILTSFSTDKYGRRYQPTWLALAKYDEATDSWTYYGANSTTSKYIGWDYQIDWYNADGVVIASDCVRINLANEECYFTSEPYYVSGIMKEVDTKIEEKIATIESAYEIVEF